MAEESSKGKRMVTVKLDADVHQMFKILAKRYKTQGKVGKGKVSISDAARFFIEEHEVNIANTALQITDAQDEAARTDHSDD